MPDITPVSPPPLTPAPTAAPQRGDRSTFAARVDAFNIWLTAAVAEFSALATNAYTNALAAFSAAASAKTLADAASSSAGAAAVARDAAAAAALTAVNSPGTSATSTTTLTVSAGTKEFSIQPGKAFVSGQFVTVSSSAGEYMLGRIAEHDTATGASRVDVTYAHGSATASAWVIAVAAVAPSGVPVGTLVTDADVAMQGGAHYVLTATSAVAATLPAAPIADDWLWITVDNGRVDNTLNLNGRTLTGPAGAVSGVVTLNVRDHVTIGLRYINDTIQWRLV